MEKQILVYGKAAQKLSENMYYLHNRNRQKESTFRKYDEESSEAGGLRIGVMENVKISRNTFIAGMLCNANFPVLTNWDKVKIKCELGILSSYCGIRANTPGKAEQASSLQIFWVT